MRKNMQAIAIVFLGICILLGSWIVSKSFNGNNSKMGEQFRYDFVPTNGENVIIFDKKTGDYWQKFISPSEGPTDWEKQETPNIEEK